MVLVPFTQLYLLLTVDLGLGPLMRVPRGIIRARQWWSLPLLSDVGQSPAALAAATSSALLGDLRRWQQHSHCVGHLQGTGRLVRRLWVAGPRPHLWGQVVAVPFTVTTQHFTADTHRHGYEHASLQQQPFNLTAPFPEWPLYGLLVTLTL